MKLRCVLLIFMSFPVMLPAQSKTRQTPKENVNRTVVQDRDVEIYSRAVAFGDYDVARNSLYALIVRYPDSLNFMDSLVTLYFSLGQMPQCILAGNEYLGR